MQAVSLWLLPRFARAGGPHGVPRLTRGQWLATIGVDLVVFSTLHLFGPSAGLNYVALLVLPVLMAGVLTSRLLALATASRRGAAAAGGLAWGFRLKAATWRADRRRPVWPASASSSSRCWPANWRAGWRARR